MEGTVGTTPITPACMVIDLTLGDRQLQGAQEQLPEIREIKEALIRGEQQLGSTRVEQGDGKSLSSEWNRLEIRQGILGRHWTVQGRHTVWQAYVPPGLRRELIQQYHAGPLAGHNGMAKTYAALQRTYFWPGMTKDVKVAIKLFTVPKEGWPPQEGEEGTLRECGKL